MRHISAVVSTPYGRKHGIDFVTSSPCYAVSQDSAVGAALAYIQKETGRKGPFSANYLVATGSEPTNKLDEMAHGGVLVISVDDGTDVLAVFHITIPARPRGCTCAARNPESDPPCPVRLKRGLYGS